MTTAPVRLTGYILHGGLLKMYSTPDISSLPAAEHSDRGEHKFSLKLN
jgi:hypothetical protein